MKTNYKRVIKTINKLGKNSKHFYIQRVNNSVLVSQGHFIVFIPASDYDEYKSELKGVIEERDLLKYFYENMDGTEVDMRMTTAQIDFYFGERTARVFKHKDLLMGVNQQFVDMIKDTIYQDKIDTDCKARDKKSPLFYAEKVYDTEKGWQVVGGFMLLPITLNIREELNKILLY